ncbi:hypothetical protein PROVRETT_06915 [Providencia rettgeri DSM 1131]|nr:hypothetical protein PROVRETT_06915 [Providencia rettgeri DSM 1131]
MFYRYFFTLKDKLTSIFRILSVKSGLNAIFKHFTSFHAAQ